MDDGTTNRAVTYGSYLRVDDLLELQQPRSSGPEHDELLFIVIHQVYELWFKELLHEFDRVSALLTADETHRAQHTLKRILTILKVMVAQLDILETMTPLEFLSFRARLEAASGFQSDQFRQIEFVLGAKSEGALARFPERSRAREALPFAAVPSAIARTGSWVRPDLVAEIAFTEWTRDGRLRHPSFQGLRRDKKATEVRREQPATETDR